MSVPYEPGPLPDDAKQLPQAVRREFRSLKEGLEAAWDFGEQRYLVAEPARLRPGLIVLADGTLWNPGSGAGLYRRDATNASWIPCFGSTSSAWTTYTPTVTTGSGTITTLGTVSGRYRVDGKTLFLSVIVPITTNGTGATDVRASLPSGMTAAAEMALCAKEMTNGYAQSASIASGASVVVVLRYDGFYPGASGYRIVVNGAIEIA